MSMPQRKERATRYRKRVAVQFGAQRLTGGGFTTNVSTWGMSLAAPSLHLPGTSLQLEARLGDGQPAMMTVIVTWARRGSAALGVPNTMGLRIVTADQRWLSFVASLDKPAAPLARGRTEASGRVLGRYGVDWPVRLGLGEKLDKSGQTIDVSAMGLSMSSTMVASVGTRLFFEVTLPEGTAVRCEGQVVRAARSPGAGAGAVAMAVRLIRADERWYREVLALERARG